MPINFTPDEHKFDFQPLEPDAVKLSAGETAIETLKSLGRGFSEMVKSPGVMMKAYAETGTDESGLLAKIGKKVLTSSPLMPSIPSSGAPSIASMQAAKQGDKAGVEAGMTAVDRKVIDFKDAIGRAGQNIINYYDKGIQGNVLAPSDKMQAAREESFMAHPIARTATAVTESAPTYIAGLTATLLTKNPWVGASLLASSSGTQTYETLRADNVDPDLALLGGVIAGSIEAVTEKVPFDLLLKGGGKPLLKRFLLNGTAESLQELMATMGQNYVQEALKDVDPKDHATIIPALQQEWSDIMAGWEDSMAAGFVMGGGAAIATGGGAAPDTKQPQQTAEKPKFVDDLTDKTYMKGFAARLTSIRNNADNAVAMSKNPKFKKKIPQQTKTMKEEVNKIVEHYDSIADVIEENQDVMPELKQIKDLLPQYQADVDAFAKKPTKEGFAAIKQTGDQIAQLSQDYGDKAAQQLAETSQAATDVTAQEKYDALIERVNSGDEKAAQELNDLNYDMAHPESKLPTYDELLIQANEGDAEAIAAIQDGKYKGGEQQAKAVTEMEQTTAPVQMTEADRKHANFLKVKAHALAKALKIPAKRRKEINKALTGKESMQGMTLEESQAVVEEFVRQANEAGITTATSKELTQHLNTAHGAPTEKGVLGGEEQSKLKAMTSSISKGFAHYFGGLQRIPRMLEALDGFVQGPMFNSIWKPVKAAADEARSMKQIRVSKFIEAISGVVGGEKNLRKFLSAKKTQVLPVTKNGPALTMSPTEKIAVYVYSQNSDSQTHLRSNFKKYANPDAAIADVLTALTEQERQIGDMIINEIETNYPRAKQAAMLGLGRDLAKLDRYFPMIIADPDAEQSPDPLQSLLEMQKTGRVQEVGEVKARVSGASQPLVLDVFTNYLRHIDRIEQFIHMAPVARSVGALLSDTKLRQSIDNATQDTGTRVLDKWLRDSVRGYSTESNTWIGKAMLQLRQRGIIYALAGNVPSVMRQFLSLPHAMAIDPTMAAHTALNLMRTANPMTYNKMRAEVMQKSKMLRGRTFDRIQATIQSQTKAKQDILKKKPWSSKALSWQRWADERTVVNVWKGAYDAAGTEAVQKRFNLDGSEKSRVEFADITVERTQPMGNVEHLPDFFRGGPLEKLLSTFQNQVNNNWNFWAHDIYGMRKHGKISNTQVAYRVMMSYAIPALIFGIIGRGGLPKDWKDVAFDEVVYALGPLFLVGRVIDSAIRGFAGGTGGVQDIAPTEAAKTIQSLKQGNPEKAALHGVKTVGAATGRIPAQAIRTAEGAYDLATGETEDLRRLIWSEWALGDDEKKE